jgi:uncharacterized protein (TIGR02466 family)
MSQNPEISYQFSTPICKFSLSGFDDKQQELVKHIRKLRRTTKGIQSSNYDGWHSERNFHTDTTPVVQWLVRRVNMAAIKAIQKLNNTSEGVDIRLREMWVNINRKGNWNMPHIHAVKWSGVIYVEGEHTPEKDLQDGKHMHEGDTVFLNPVPEAAYFGQPNSVPYSFKAGQILFFPGYLLHMVVPHKSNKNRITIAFNVDLSQLESQRKQSPKKVVETTPASINPRLEIIG